MLDKKNMFDDSVFPTEELALNGIVNAICGAVMHGLRLKYPDLCDARSYLKAQVVETEEEANTISS